MNGAAAVVDSRIKAPKSSKTIMMGRSHHFLFWARNNQNSLSRLSAWESAAAFSNSLGGLDVVWLIVVVRFRIVRPAVTPRTVRERAHHNPGWASASMPLGARPIRDVCN